MNFLQAHAAVKALQNGRPLRFTLVSSGVTATLDLFLRAHAAQAGFEAQVDTIPFNSLAQRIRLQAAADSAEVFLLLPWDLLPLADWRTGLPVSSLGHEEAEGVLAEHVSLFLQRSRARFVYLPAPIPPMGATSAACAALEAQILTAARRLGALELSRSAFNLASYLESGNPLASQSLSEVAQRVIEAALTPAREPKKVLITDLDNTVWSGVIGEDGVEGIAYAPEGRGYPFFVYQTLLRKLRQEGVILAAVSRNDPDLALAPFKGGQMTLREADLVTIIASYNSKSAQISQLAQELNLGLDSFVFVDDNPIEIEEVSRALPSVTGVLFDSKSAALPGLLERLTGLFGKATVTEDDARRTEMYRTRLKSAAPSTAQGADLTEFLSSLQMSLTIRERSPGDHARCLQLINKTNQFNFNGRRISEAELEATLTAGGHLIGATLDDRNGTHGEVIACLIDAEGTIEAFVMSCRVFQRRAEFAFVAWLAAQRFAPRQYRYVPTERNEPVRMFLEQLKLSPVEGLIPFDGARMREECAADLALFRVLTA